jgi:hypothetical protein
MITWGSLAVRTPCMGDLPLALGPDTSHGVCLGTRRPASAVPMLFLKNLRADETFRKRGKIARARQSSKGHM